jgi:hypothetical protein
MGMSDAKINDARCGLESMGSNMIAALSGANVISGCGMMDFESCLSIEKLVIDAEVIGMVERLVRGIELRDDPIALSLMRQDAHKGNFLSLPETDVRGGEASALQPSWRYVSGSMRAALAEGFLAPIGSSGAVFVIIDIAARLEIEFRYGQEGKFSAKNGNSVRSEKANSDLLKRGRCEN